MYFKEFRDLLILLYGHNIVSDEEFLLQLSVAVNKKMYFKEFRDLLILLYGHNIVSDEEFLLLYDTFKTKNLEFPHGNYERFDLDSMNSAKCKAEFRVEKQDLPRLVAAPLPSFTSR